MRNDSAVAKARKKKPFDLRVFLHSVGDGRSVLHYRKNQKVFSQGDPADAVFYIQEGKVKVSVVSERGKEAVIGIHADGEFFGAGMATTARKRFRWATLGGGTR
jgi:CRP/FNR family cyclic AMP-dependent transcriptional regulator